MTWTQDEADRIHRCRECGEIGRYKKVMNVRGRLSLYCHEEEKSCFNYVTRNFLQEAMAARG